MTHITKLQGRTIACEYAVSYDHRGWDGGDDEAHSLRRFLPLLQAYLPSQCLNLQVKDTLRRMVR